MSDPHAEFQTSLTTKLTAIFADTSHNSTPESKAAEIAEALSDELKTLLAARQS